MQHKAINPRKKEDSLVLLGEITSPHGLQGHVKVKTHTQKPTDLLKYPLLQEIDNTFHSFRLLSVLSPHSALLSLEGVCTRDDAEKRRGVKLYVKRENFPPLDEDEFYYTDLIGMMAWDNNSNQIGVVHSVHNHGAGCFLEIITLNQDIYSLPFRKESVPSIDIEGGFLLINPAFLMGEKG